MALFLPLSTHAALVFQQPLHTTDLSNTSTYLGSGYAVRYCVDAQSLSPNKMGKVSYWVGGGTPTGTTFAVFINWYNDTTCSTQTGSFGGITHDVGSDLTGFVSNTQQQIDLTIDNVDLATSSANHYMRIDIYRNGGSNCTGLGTRCGAYATFGMASTSNYNNNAYFQIYDTFGNSTVDTTKTYIADVTPPNGATVATSTTFTFGGHGYVTSADFVSGMYLQIKYVRLSDLQAAVANVDNLYTVFNIPITQSGEFTLSTTTSLINTGQYQILSSIRSPSLVNNFFNFLGFGQFATLGIQSATTTVFTAAHLSGYDIFVASTTASIDSYLASSTISMASCSSWVSFNLADCMNLLFVPQVGPIRTALNSFKDGFLSYAPWGYMTRFLVIVSGSATTSLPAISIPTPLGDPSKPSYINGSFTLDPNDMLRGGGALVNSIQTTYGDGGVHKTVQDVAQPFVRLIIGLALLFWIIRDIMGMRHQHKPSGRLH